MWNTLCIFIDVGSLILYATGETCFTILKGPYCFGANFFDLTFILRLCESNYTLLPVTDDLGILLGLIYLSRDFCVSVHALASSANLSYASGMESSGIFRFVVGLIPKINWCGVCCVPSCFHKLCVNSAIGSSVL
jgi:hypothetical protein